MTEKRRPVHATGALQIEHCDVPAELTLGEWRRRCAAERRAAAAESADRDLAGAMRRGLRRLLGG